MLRRNISSLTGRVKFFKYFSVENFPLCFNGLQSSLRLLLIFLSVKMSPFFPTGARLMLRDRIKESLKEAMKSKDKRRISTLRLIIATLQDRDLAARDKGAEKGITDEEILQMLTTMVRQRKDSIAAYEKGGRADLATAEQEEIDIISEYLPKQFDEAETRAAVAEVIEDISAQGLKDMGRTMAELKIRFAGQMDFSKASAIVKEALGA